MTFGVPIVIEIDNDDAKRWAGRVEYIPEIILSSIEDKLKSGQQPSQIKNLNTIQFWFEHFFTFLNSAKEELDKDRAMKQKKKPPIYADLYNTLQNVQFKAAEIKKNFPKLYAQLDDKFNFARTIDLSEDLFAKADKSKINPITYATGQKSEDAQKRAKKYVNEDRKKLIATLKEDDKSPVFAKTATDELAEGLSIETFPAKNKKPTPLIVNTKNKQTTLNNNCVSKVKKYSGKDAVFKGTITGRIVDIIAKYHGLDTFDTKTPAQRKTAYNHLLSYLSNNPKTREILNKALQNYKVYKKAKTTDEGLILDEKNLTDPKKLQPNYFVYLPPGVLDDKNLIAALQDYKEQDLFAQKQNNKKRLAMR